MKCFTKSRIKKGVYRYTFTKAYFDKMLAIHPFASQLLIHAIIKATKELGMTVFIDEDQVIILEDRMKQHKWNYSFAQTPLEQTFTKNFSMRGIDLEKAPEILDEVYKIIEGTK